MNVSINGSIYEFQSDYSHKNRSWQQKLVDFYTFQKIGHTDCFIKRSEIKPSAWNLLVKLRQEKPVFLPQVYDVAITKELNKEIFYHFTQKIEGETLVEAIKANKPIDLRKLLRHIAQALGKLHQLGFWFSDLNEENIFVGADGNYYLIDLDSCWELAVKPNPMSNELGFVPGKAQEFVIAVIDFYKKIAGQKNFDFNTLVGNNLNYLQLLMIITKIAYYEEQKQLNSRFFYIGTNFKEVDFSQKLYKKCQLNAKGLFIKALSSNLFPEMVISTGKFITGEQILAKPKAKSELRARVGKTTSKKQKASKAATNTPPLQSKPKVVQLEKKSNNWTIAATILLLIFGGGGSFYGYQEYQFKEGLMLGNDYYYGANSEEKNYRRALASYEDALVYWSRFHHLADAKIDKIETESNIFIKEKETVINSLIDRGNLTSASRAIDKIKESHLYTYSIALETTALDKKLKIAKANKSLLAACKSGNINQLNTALADGADPNFKDDQNKPSIFWAAEKDNYSVFEKLVSKGANLQIKDRYSAGIYTYAKSKKIKDFLKSRGFGKFEYYDDFTSIKKFREDYNSYNDGKTYYSGSSLYVENTVDGNFYTKRTSFYELDLSYNYEVECKMKVLDYLGTGFLVGIVVGSNYESDMICLLINHNQQSKVSNRENGEWKNSLVSWTKINKISSQYSWIKMKAIKKNNSISFYIDDVYTGQIDTSNLKGNQFGFYTQSKAKIKVDYFKLTGFKK